MSGSNKEAFVPQIIITMTIESEPLLGLYEGHSDGFYAQACQGQLIYSGGEFNMRQSN